MATSVKPVPDGASVVIPRLVCQDVAAAIEFCTHTFGAVERVRRPGPDGAVGACPAHDWPGDDHDRSRVAHAAEPRSEARRQFARGDLRLRRRTWTRPSRARSPAERRCSFPCRTSSGVTGSRGSWTRPAMCGQWRHGSKRPRLRRETAAGPASAMRRVTRERPCVSARVRSAWTSGWDSRTRPADSGCKMARAFGKVAPRCPSAALRDSCLLRRQVG